MVVSGKPRIHKKKQSKETTQKGSCVVCGTIFGFKAMKKYCSKKCSKESLEKRQPKCKHNLPSSTIGSISELLVCVDLMKKGYSAFRCVSPNAKFDLVAFKLDIFLKIEVTTGTFLPSGKIVHTTKDKNNFDILAIVILPDKIIYEPPLEYLQEQCQ